MTWPELRAGDGSGDDKTFIVSTRSHPLDTGQQWRKDGEERIETGHGDDIHRPGSYSYKAGARR